MYATVDRIRDIFGKVSEEDQKSYVDRLHQALRCKYPNTCETQQTISPAEEPTLAQFDKEIAHANPKHRIYEIELWFRDTIGDNWEEHRAAFQECLAPRLTFDDNLKSIVMLFVSLRGKKQNAKVWEGWKDYFIGKEAKRKEPKQAPDSAATTSFIATQQSFSQEASVEFKQSIRDITGNGDYDDFVDEMLGGTSGALQKRLVKNMKETTLWHIWKQTNEHRSLAAQDDRSLQAFEREMLRVREVDKIHVVHLWHEKTIGYEWDDSRAGFMNMLAGVFSSDERGRLSDVAHLFCVLHTRNRHRRKEGDFGKECLSPGLLHTFANSEESFADSEESNRESEGSDGEADQE